MSNAISVTEVRNALRCPRIFALGRTERTAVEYPVAASALGAAFHRIVGRFAGAIMSPSAVIARLEVRASEAAVTAAISRTLLALLADEIANTASYASMPAEIDDLAEALRELARYLAREARPANLPAATRPADALAAFLRTSEADVGDTLELDDGHVVLITGRLDALHARPSGTLEVVEYKLTPDSNDALDRAQVALYRYLLRATHDLEARPVLLRFQPTLTVTRIDAGEADALVEKRLLPLVRDMVVWATEPEHAPPTDRTDLCPTCPVRGTCAIAYPGWLPPRDEPPAGAKRPIADPRGRTVVPRPLSRPPLGPVEDDAGQAEVAEIAASIVRIYRSQGVAVETRDLRAGARHLSVRVQTKQRGSIRALDARAADVEHVLASERDANASFVKRGGLRFYEIARRTPRPVLLAPLLARAEGPLRERSGRFIVGEDVDGDVVTGDLGDPASCHLLIGGTTGSGKTVLLRTLIASLAHFHGPDAIRFTLIDPKRVSFVGFRSSIAAHLSAPICFDAAVALEHLEGFVSEMEERYALFERANVEDIVGFNALAGGEALVRHVIVMDEFADLVTDKESRDHFFSVVQRLGQKARAAGIHLVLATQRPDRQTVPGIIKTNLAGRIALRVPDRIASRIILDEGGAEDLLGHGDLIYQFGRGARRAQAAQAATPS